MRCSMLPEHWSTQKANVKRVITAFPLLYEPYLLKKANWTQSGRDFLNAMNLREAADYEAEFSEAGVTAVITTAEKFIGIEFTQALVL